MHRIAASLERLHLWIRSQPLLYRLVLGTRILLAVGFIPTGTVKLLGLRFTRMDPATPLGGFFETLYQSGLYWEFLGLSQVIAGVLILIPATATVGAVIFFPLILNIFVITLSYDFRGTPFITGLMLLASISLLVWDYDRLKGLLGIEGSSARLPRHRLSRVELGLYVLGGACGLLLFGMMRGLPIPRDMVVWLLGSSAASALAALALGVAKARSRTKLSPASR